MHFSIYNDNRIDTKSFIATNLIKSSHFPWTVRTPPNCYKNYFIGELTNRVKPRFDIDLTNSSIFIPKNKTLNNFRHNHNGKNLINKSNSNSNNFPSLFSKTLSNNSINRGCNTRNIKLVKHNDKYNYNFYFKEICFSYNKPKMINPNIINYNKLLIYNNKNKNLQTIQNSRKNRLFLKSFTKFQLLIDKPNTNKN